MSDITMGKQSSKMNVRHYNGVNRGENECQTIQWGKQRRGKWMSDNTMEVSTAVNECQTIQWGKQSSKVNVRQYNVVNRAVKWMSDNTMGKQSCKMNVRQQ